LLAASETASSDHIHVYWGHQAELRR
jgi:hypothetical protein